MSLTNLYTHIKAAAATTKWNLDSDHVGIDSLNELGELRPVVLDAEKEAVGVPSQKLQWLLFLIPRRRFTAGLSYDVPVSGDGASGGPLVGGFLLYGLEEALHRRSSLPPQEQTSLSLRFGPSRLRWWATDI